MRTCCVPNLQWGQQSHPLISKHSICAFSGCERAQILCLDGTGWERKRLLAPQLSRAPTGTQLLTWQQACRADQGCAAGTEGQQAPLELPADGQGLLI